MPSPDDERAQADIGSSTRGAARSAQEPLAAPVRLEGLSPRSSARLRLAGFLAALVGHAAVLYWATREPPAPLAGGGGHLLDAVDVTFVHSEVLEAREADHSEPPAPAAADMVDVVDGNSDSAPAPPLPEAKKTSRDQGPPREPVPAAAVVKEPPPKTESRQPSVPERKGAAAARGEAATAAKKITPAAARRGAVRRYTNAMIAALAKCKPKRGLGYGTVRVKLVVAPGGGIALLEILKSSGNRRLKNAALAAVRRCPIPVPPPGFTRKERWFEWNLYVRR